MTALRLLTFTILSVPLQAIAQQTQEPTTPPYYGFGPWHHMMRGYAGWWMFGMMLFFFLIACVAVFLLAQGWSDRDGHFCGFHRHVLDQSDVNRSALQMLNERFARSEIQKEVDASRHSQPSRGAHSNKARNPPWPCYLRVHRAAG